MRWHAKNSIGNAKTGAAKNNDKNAKNSIEKSDKQRVSPRPLLGQIGKPAASAGLVPLKPFDAKKPLVLATPSQTYFIKKYKNDKIEQSMKLRDNLDSIQPQK